VSDSALAGSGGPGDLLADLGYCREMRRRTTAAVLCLGLLVGCGSGGGSVSQPTVAPPDLAGGGTSAPGPGTQDAAETGTVTNVVDGDTVDVEGVGRIRVIGIDTPERGACGYESATQAMSVLVLGRPVSLVPGATEDADRYGRLLRYVDVGSQDAGLSLIEDGWAIARYDSRDGYGRHPRQDTYVSADMAAEDLGCYPDDEP
jgi:endonuclease YncB( thermonuclease family)